MVALAISLTECQEALSERQFGKQTHDTYFVWSWRSRTKRWYWFLNISGTSPIFSGIFPSKMNLTTVSSAQMGEIMATPMFISASQNTTLIKPLWHWHCIYTCISNNGRLQLLTHSCVYANRAESVTNWWDFFPSVTWTEGESETALLERLFIIYWFYKNKMIWWIFNIIGWLFSHIAATQMCSNTL